MKNCVFSKEKQLSCVSTVTSVVDPDPHHFGNLDPHPDLHPHKKTRVSDPH